MRDAKTGQTLVALKNRAGLSLEAIAQRGGYAGRSSVQHFFSTAYEKPLDTAAANKLADALEGAGTPPIERREVLALSGVLDLNGVVQNFEGASDDRMQHNLPIYGTALGADKIIDGQAIEQAHLNTGDIIGYAKRPVLLDGRGDAYGIYVQGSSMEPAYDEGSLILVEVKRPPRVNDYVVVYLRQNGSGDDSDDGMSARMVMVKRLERRSASFVELRQFNPPMTFKIAAADVLKMHRVIPWQELLS